MIDLFISLRQPDQGCKRTQSVPFGSSDGESARLVSCQHNTSSTEQFIVIFQDFVLGQAEASSHLTPVSICGIQCLCRVLYGHPYLTVRRQPNQTIWEMQFNVVPTDYDMGLIIIFFIHTNVVGDDRGFNKLFTDMTSF